MTWPSMAGSSPTKTARQSCWAFVRPPPTRGLYVFTESSPDTWSELQRIPNPDAKASLRFGHGLASDLTSSRFVVGAPYHDDGATDGFGNPLWGKLYFYVLSGGSYTVEDTVTATKPVYGGGGGGLGDFVSMDGAGLWSWPGTTTTPIPSSASERWTATRAAVLRGHSSTARARRRRHQLFRDLEPRPHAHG